MFAFTGNCFRISLKRIAYILAYKVQTCVRVFERLHDLQSMSCVENAITNQRSTVLFITNSYSRIERNSNCRNGKRNGISIPISIPEWDWDSFRTLSAGMGVGFIPKTICWNGNGSAFRRSPEWTHVWRLMFLSETKFVEKSTALCLLYWASGNHVIHGVIRVKLSRAVVLWGLDSWLAHRCEIIRI